MYNYIIIFDYNLVLICQVCCVCKMGSKYWNFTLNVWIFGTYFSDSPSKQRRRPLANIRRIGFIKTCGRPVIWGQIKYFYNTFGVLTVLSTWQLLKTITVSSNYDRIWH